MPLSDQEEKEFQECFEMFDEEGEESINVGELNKMLRLLGWDPTESELQEIVRKSGLRSAGKMTKPQFLKLMERWCNSHQNKQSEEELKQAFQVFDKDGSGYIEWNELKYVMQGAGEPLTDEEVTVMMKEADKDGDGRIDYEEFVAMMKGDSFSF
ncbi:calmodulin-like protein 6 [Clavelina lepadiformis]